MVVLPSGPKSANAAESPKREVDTLRKLQSNQLVQLFDELYFSSFRNRRSSGNIALKTPFLLQSEASIVTDDVTSKHKKLQNSNEKLHNSNEKLHNSGRLTAVEKQIIAVTSLQDVGIKQALEAQTHEAEKWDLEKRKVEALEHWVQLQQKWQNVEPNKHSFTKDELDRYVAHRKQGLADKSLDWINRPSRALWNCTKGEISHASMIELRTFVLEKYTSVQVHKIVLGFASAFLKHLSIIRFDTSYHSYAAFLELPKTVKVRKGITGRIVTRENISSLFKCIEACAENAQIDAQKARNYRAYSLLAAYTGLRPSTMKRLTIGQFKTALNEEKPVLHVLAEQEKSRVEHYVPLHPLVVEVVKEVLKLDFDGKDGGKPFFMSISFEKWLKRYKIPLPRVRDPKKAHLWLSDFRKFAEQFGDKIGWDSTNCKYVLAHGMTGVDWAHYKHPLPEDVYDIYLRSWGAIDLSS